MPNFAQQCTFPRTASQKLSCPVGEIFSSSGYEVTAGTLPNYSVQTAGGDIFAVSGVSRDDSAEAVRLTPVCLIWAAKPAPAAASWVLPAGAALLLLLALLVMFSGARQAQTAQRRHRPGGHGEIPAQRLPFRPAAGGVVTTVRELLFGSAAAEVEAAENWPPPAR